MEIDNVILDQPSPRNNLDLDVDRRELLRQRFALPRRPRAADRQARRRLVLDVLDVAEAVRVDPVLREAVRELFDAVRGEVAR